MSPARVPVRVEDPGVVETLRRLRAPKPAPVERFGDVAIVAPQERICKGQGGGGGRMKVERRKHPPDQVLRYAGAGDVMDVWQEVRRRMRA